MMTFHAATIEHNQTLNQERVMGKGVLDLNYVIYEDLHCSFENEGNELMLTICIMHMRPKRAANASYTYTLYASKRLTLL